MDRVVILNMHGIGAPSRPLEPGEDDVWITLGQFEQILDSVIGRDDVQLTFDDGNVSDTNIALPMLIERSLTAEFFVCPGLFGDSGRLAADGVCELLKAGMAVGSHGWAHVDWRRSNASQIVQELQESRNALRQLAGAEIEHVSVPFGSYDRHVLRQLRHFGVSRVYTSDRGRARPRSWLQPRTSVPSTLDQAWIDRVLEENPPLRGRIRDVAARSVKRSRGEWRLGRTKPDLTVPWTPALKADTIAAPKLGIVIVTYNSAVVLSRCLSSLRAGSTGVDLTDVVVVDNASSDESIRIATHFEDFPVRTVGFGINAGYAAGVNAGVNALDTNQLDAVLILNPDCSLRPGALAVLAGNLGLAGRGIVVPKLLNPDGRLQPSLRKAPAVHRSLAESLFGSMASRLGISELVVSPKAYAHSGQWAWATGAAMLMSTSMLRHIGPWDESFLLYSEETEFALRAADHGWQLWYEPAAVIEHIGGTSHTEPQFAGLLAANRVRLYYLRHGLVRSGAFYLVELLGTALRAGMGRQQARAALSVLLRPSRRMRALPEPK